MEESKKKHYERRAYYLIGLGTGWLVAGLLLLSSHKDQAWMFGFAGVVIMLTGGVYSYLSRRPAHVQGK